MITGSETSPDDKFARIAFGLLVGGLGAVGTQRLLRFGRRRIEEGHQGITYNSADHDMSVVVRREGIDFVVPLFGGQHIPHELADEVIRDIQPGEAPA